MEKLANRGMNRIMSRVTQRWKAGGEMKEYTERLNIEAWGALGEIAQANLKKGRLVFVEGRLKTDRVGEGENTKYYTKVVALPRSSSTGNQPKNR